MKIYESAVRKPISTILLFVGVMVFAGPTSVIAGLLLALAAVGIGSRIVGDGRGIALSLLVGLAVVAAVVGWLLPLPIHHRATYAIACIALIAWRHRVIAAACGEAWRRFDDAARAAPRASSAAILLLGLASTGAWLPTMQYDDVVYHLGLPWQLQETARYAMDPSLQVWALAPWAGDVLQGVAQVLAGGEARGALDALWLAIAAGAVFALAGALGADATRRWWAIALLGSLPMSMNLVGGMQTELPAMALLPVLAWLVLREAASGSPWSLMGDGAR